MGDLRACDIAKFLDTPLQGEDIVLKSVSALNDIKAFSLSFSKSKSFNTITSCLILVPLDFEETQSSFSYIPVKNPRLAFAKVLAEFFVAKPLALIDSTVSIGKNSFIDKSVSIGKYSVIGDNVSIGEDTVINAHVVIGDNTIIGKKCYIKSGTIIGEDGFGFDFEEDGTPVRIPHLGSVIIGNNVEIGAKNTISRGTLENTIIESDVKIDDQVHIAHNCIVGKNTIITACAEISGSVIIGKNCWIGPNSSIMQKVKIGDNTTIGIGTIITQNIDSNKKIMGFEGLDLRSLLKLKKRIEYGK